MTEDDLEVGGLYLCQDMTCKASQSLCLAIGNMGLYARVVNLYPQLNEQPALTINPNLSNYRIIGPAGPYLTELGETLAKNGVLV